MPPSDVDPGGNQVVIRMAASPADLDSFRRLTLEYTAWLGEDLAFQGLAAELAGLPGAYSPPRGAILLAALPHPASPGGHVIGTVALRPLPDSKPASQAQACSMHAGDPTGACQEATGADAAGAGGCACAAGEGGLCELKRLYVLPGHRRRSVGRALVAAALAAARRAGYTAAVLDTLDRLAPANRLYASLGFQPGPAYYHNPLPGVQFWRLELTTPTAAAVSGCDAGIGDEEYSSHSRT